MLWWNNILFFFFFFWDRFSSIKEIKIFYYFDFLIYFNKGYQVKYIYIIYRLIISCNFSWKFDHEVRSIISKLFKLNKLLPMYIIRIVNNALHKSIFQHGLLVWCGCTNNTIRPLEIQQNPTIRIFLNKKELCRSTATNYKVLKVLPVRYPYNKFSIMFRIDKFSIQKNNGRKNKSYYMKK